VGIRTSLRMMIRSGSARRRREAYVSTARLVDPGAARGPTAQPLPRLIRLQRQPTTEAANEWTGRRDGTAPSSCPTNHHPLMIPIIKGLRAGCTTIEPTAPHPQWLHIDVEFPFPCST